MKRPPHLQTYSNWEEACGVSKWGKAVGQIQIDHRGALQRVEIIKPRHGDAMITYYHSGLEIRKATTQEVDSCTKWKPY